MASGKTAPMKSVGTSTKSAMNPACVVSIEA
jgi:hypothetical protein